MGMENREYPTAPLKKTLAQPILLGCVSTVLLVCAALGLVGTYFLLGPPWSERTLHDVIGRWFLAAVWLFGTWEICLGNRPAFLRIALILAVSAVALFVAIIVAGSWFGPRISGHSGVQMVAGGGGGILFISPIIAGLIARMWLVKKGTSIWRMFIRRDAR